MALVILPLAPVNPAWWNVSSAINGDLKEEIGWPELVEAVAAVRDSLPEADRTRAGILAGNYGEASAKSTSTVRCASCPAPSAASTPTGGADIRIPRRKRWSSPVFHALRP
jgi:hypothetical protein